MYQNQISEEVITEYIFRQRLYNSMHLKLRQQAELVYQEDDTFKQIIRDVERIDTVLRDTGVCKNEKRDYSLGSLKPKDRQKSKGKSAKGYKKQDRDDKKAGPTCYSCSGKCNDPTIGSYNHYHLSPNGIPSGNQRWYGLVYFIQIAGQPGSGLGNC